MELRKSGVLGMLYDAFAGLARLRGMQRRPEQAAAMQ
jgi:hypothetical protein